jgi:hypothetical protein
MTNGRTNTNDILGTLSEFDEESKLSNDKIVKNLESNWKIPSVIYHYPESVTPT